MNYNDSTRTGKPHPNDGTAMRRYSQTYAYDEVGNLLEVVHTPSSGTGWTRTYTIDSASNRLDENSIGSNAVTAESYTYDARGNIITGFNHLTSLTYNEENRLEKVVLADTNITSYYQYDGSGQRVRKVTKDNNSNGYKQVRKYVGSWEVYEKIDSNNDVVSQRETLHIMDDRARVALIDTPVIAESNTEVQLLRYQFSNHLQTATLELDKVAAIISYEEYYPFGSTSFQSGRSASEVSRKRYRYTGKEKDEETGLYYHGARYYIPWLCRWCAVDPINNESYNHSKGQPAKNHERDFVELTASSYEYCYDNPVRFNDPEGEQPPGKKLEELQNKHGACVKIPLEETKQSQPEKKTVTKHIDTPKKEPVDPNKGNVAIKVGTHDKVKYVKIENKEIRVGGTPAWINNNPGNIISGKKATSLGAIGQHGKFAVFPNHDTGFNAIGSLLKGSAYKDSTISGAIKKYAPASDNNDPVKYAKSITKNTGISDTLKIMHLDSLQLHSVMKMIEKVEGSTPGKQYFQGAKGNPSWVDSLFNAKPDTTIKPIIKIR